MFALIVAETSTASNAEQHLKADGTPDMRFTENQEAAASGETENSSADGKFSLIFLLDRVVRTTFL